MADKNPEIPSRGKSQSLTARSKGVQTSTVSGMLNKMNVWALYRMLYQQHNHTGLEHAVL
jgi:hypothetical protein